jgi:putative oxidoreductase
MSAIEKLEKWGELHHSKWMDALRIMLGLILHFKGLLFMFHTAELMRLLQLNLSSEDAVILAHVLAFMHIFFGTLILIGVGTRFSCLVMIPVLFTSIIFVGIHFGSNLVSDLILSIVVLFLLVFFFIEGSGNFSVSHYMSRSRKSRESITDTPERP